MSDFKLDDNWDLELTKSNITLIETIEKETVQRLKIKFYTYLGEWYLNKNVGIPYFQTIFKKGTPKAVVDGIFKTLITNDRNVVSLDKYESQITRGYEYVMAFTATVNQGKVVTAVFVLSDTNAFVGTLYVNYGEGDKPLNVVLEDSIRKFNVRGI